MENILLGAQLTIIGLIFPLVIGFIGMLLKDRSANRALWEIFNRYSGFMFAGFSGLMLSAVIVLGQFIHPWQSYTYDVIFSVGICVWFVFNLFLTAWFLHATYLFIGVDSRSRLVVRYCINEALITDIKFRLSQLIPMTAIERGLLNKNDTWENAPQVKTINYSTKGSNPYSIKFRHRKYVNNIYFRMLNLSVKTWKLFPSKEKAELTLPISDSSISRNEWDLAFTTGSDLKLTTKMLIRASYVFGDSPAVESSNIKQSIHALVGNIEDALRENNIRLFEIAVDEMVQWHSDLMNAAAFIDDNGEWDNWLLLSEGMFFGRTVLDELSKEYYGMSRSVVDLLPKSTEYFHTLCYFHLRIYGEKNEWMTNRLAKQLITGHYNIWPVLMNWHKGVEGGKSDSLTRQQYESALIYFVGSWEAWSHPRFPELKKTKRAGSQHQIGLYIHHLESTARLIISALRHGELNAAQWSVDMLVHWYNNAIRSGSSSRCFGWNTHLLVPSLLGSDLSDPIWKEIQNGHDWNESGVICIALNNAWADICMITAVYILAKPISQLSSESNKLTAALVNGTRYKPSSSTSVDHPHVTKGSDVLQLYMRHRWYWLYDNSSHSSWLDGVVESFSRIEEKEYISGRIYTGWGCRDIHSLKSMYVAMAIGYSRSEWEFSEQTIEFLFSGVVELQHREALIRDLNEWKEPSDDSVERAKLLMGDEYTPDMLKNFKISIVKVIETIEYRHVAVIRDAAIDSDFLLEIGRMGSSTAFTLRSNQMPLSLFDDINYVNEMDDDSRCIVNITNYNRSDVAVGFQETRLTGDAEWFDHSISDNVSINLYRRLIQMPGFIVSRFDDDRALIAQVVHDAASLAEKNYRPILFVGPWNIQELLDSALWGYGAEENKIPFDTRKDDGYPESYLCHLNEIEVYQLPFHVIEFCILAPKECFEKVDVRQLDDGRYVNVKFIEDEVERSKGTLKLSYWIKPAYKKIPTFKYISGLADE